MYSGKCIQAIKDMELRLDGTELSMEATVPSTKQFELSKPKTALSKPTVETVVSPSGIAP